MARQSINVGAAPNDGSGDNIRNAFIKVNDNFVEVYSLGIKGDKGDKGDQGDQGIQGIQGDKGDTGDQGIQGIQGDKGDTGDQGIQGIKGDKGDTGDQGIQGEKGDQGDVGDQGDQGIQGEKGGLGDRGWSPVLVLETYTLAGVSRSVQKLSDYIGGTGDKPTDNVGLYLKGDGTFEANRDLASNLKGADAIELAELNNKAAGNILVADGVMFRAVSEDLFQRSNKVLDKIHPSRLLSWDDFITNEGELHNRTSPSGHNWIVKNILTDNDELGHFSVADWRSQKTSTTTGIVSLIPIAATNGLMTEIIAGINSSQATGIALNYYLNGDFIQFIFNSNFTVIKIVSGVSTTLLLEPVNTYPSTGDTNHAYKIKIEAAIVWGTRVGSVNPQISLTANAFNKLYISNDTDYVRIMKEATHVGISGFRSAIIEAIKNTII